MKKIFVSVLMVFSIVACSSSLDTSEMSMDEHFNYAKGLFDDEDYLTALNEFQAILLQYPGSAINDDAQYYLGMTYFERGEYILAAYEYSKLIRDIPASEHVPKAQFMLAESYYQLSPPYQLDQKYSKKAIEEFQAFIDFFPSNEKVDEADKKINELYTKLAEKEFSNAYIYEKMEYLYAALKYYTMVAETYHDTQFAEEALYKKITIEAVKKMDVEAAKDIKRFLELYPESEFSKEILDIKVSINNNESKD
ncbi:MAG: outer membrane protein assembly factor BamD [Melioribacteraceae bacterium]|nr:outer membrane protein assembly factor BamD [Melioribacteraceae bacterium]